MKTPIYCLPLFFKFCPTSQSSLSFPTHTPMLFLWLNGWWNHIWSAISINDIMDLHMSSLGTLVWERPWCVPHATRRQVYWGQAQNEAFYWHSDLISHIHKDIHINTHSTLRGQWTYKPMQIYICTTVMCSEQLSLLRWINNSLISKNYFPRCLFFWTIIHL